MKKFLAVIAFGLVVGSSLIPDALAYQCQGADCWGDLGCGAFPLPPCKVEVPAPVVK